MLSYIFQVVHFYSQVVKSPPVVSVIWARILCSLALRDPRLSTKITLEVHLTRSLVRAICAPRCLQSGFGVALK